jgi:ketosteroid isomerase-like protein
VPPPPPTSVPVPARNDQALIQNALTQYAAAYSRLDLDAIAAIYPNVDLAAIRKAFGDLRALQMSVENQQISISGNTATVSCTVRQVVTPRAGRATEARLQTRFELARRGDGWIITARR